MTKEVSREIELENIDARDIFGARNVFLEQIKQMHPTLRIISRGSKLKVYGSERMSERFEKQFRDLIAYYEKYGHISKEVIEQSFYQGTEPTPEIKAETQNDVIVYGSNGLIVKARTKNQKALVEQYEKSDLIFAIGPAGSGKTYTAIALAVRALKAKTVKRVILTRPAVEAGEKLGFLPGDLKEKLDPYLQPLYDALNDMIPPAKLQKFMEDGTIQISPLAYMRGRTLDNAFVILDEAQNTTLSQIKMFLTRMGCNAKFIVTGDITQIDLPHQTDSGLRKAMDIVKDIKGISTIMFNNDDIVRHPIVKLIVEAFENDRKKPKT
ncbi:MAG: PhoH family protein [Alistipes sp.]|nr:PhoH family protein [Candidatus Alistipes equi]